MQITITVEMTERNLEILKQLCQPEAEPKKKTRAKPVATNTAKPESEPAESDAPAATESELRENTPEERTPVTFTDVRAVALKLSRAGKQDILKAALAKFNAKKLSDVQTEDLEAFMKEISEGGIDA